MAEGIGAKMFEDFDPVSFRETFGQLDGLPDFLRVVELLSKPLSARDKGLIFAYLNEIAAADGQVDPREKTLLDKAARLWGMKRR